jgi:hypothetical protein
MGLPQFFRRLTDEIIDSELDRIERAFKRSETALMIFHHSGARFALITAGPSSTPACPS